MDAPEQMIAECRVCGSGRIQFLCNTHNEHSNTKTIKHYRCGDCGSVFVGNDVQSEELGVAYSSMDSQKYYEETASENRKKGETSIRHLKAHVNPDARIIDIGAGNGTFVSLLHEAGFQDVSAHEIPDSDLSKIEGIAREIYRDFDYSSIPSESFDVVTLLDVVEHVIDPSYLIRMCSRVLKPNGVIYFHTPVVTKTDRMMHAFQKLPVLKKIGTIWQRGRTSIFHLENYTPKSLTLLLENAGFGDIQVDVKNELSWPVSRYVRIYLLEKQGLPGFLAPAFVPCFYPLLATDALNANKAIACARKIKTSA